MDKYIVVNLNLFTYNHSIFIIKNKETHSLGNYTLEELPAALLHSCEQENEYNVKISGNKQFIEEFINSIKEEEIKKYSKNKIEIEVI